MCVAGSSGSCIFCINININVCIYPTAPKLQLHYYTSNNILYKSGLVGAELSYSLHSIPIEVTTLQTALRLSVASESYSGRYTKVRYWLAACKTDSTCLCCQLDRFFGENLAICACMLHGCGAGTAEEQPPCHPQRNQTEQKENAKHKL